MSVFKTMQSRHLQKKANDFIKSLENKSEKKVEQMYLDNKEFENNEIVLSYIFFHQPSLIRILPLDFQISRINSNLNMFNYGSVEARKKLVSLWIKDNKFFTNAPAVGFSEDEYTMYLKLYFKQPKDVAKLYMDDITKVLKTLVEIDLKATEDIIKDIKDDLTNRQWEFVIQAYAPFIKYATQEIQDKYSTDQKYNKYINGTARKIYINEELEKIKKDNTLLSEASLDVQSEYIKKYPYMISSLSIDSLIELLKYDTDLIKYINMPSLKDEEGTNSYELIYGLLENIENKSSKEIADLFVSKGLFNAKGKLYRFDKRSNDTSYQYTKRSILAIQKLSIDQIISLIMIDSNYALPYIVPVYSDDADMDLKEKIIIDCNSRCLNLFKTYYSSEIYDKYYKVINKIYNELLSHVDKYNYAIDYNSVFDLFKVLFNKTLINNNNVEKITIFIGMTLLYKDTSKDTRKTSINLLNDILSKGYNKEINNDEDIYEINSLEMYDDRLSFIDKDLLKDYFKYNFANISSLLFIVKAKKVNEYFKKYYSIVTSIYGENKESLFKAVENFQYYLPILKDVEDKELTSLEEENFIELLSSFGNYCNVTKKEELSAYDITLIKKLINELSNVQDEELYRNLLCNYLFNRGYNQKGNNGLLETDTIKEICDMYETELLRDFEIEGKKVFTNEECNLFSMMKLLFKDNNKDLILEYTENFVNMKLQNNIDRNIIGVIDFFNKLKKYRIDLINGGIVTLKELEEYSNARPDLITKEYRQGIAIYNVSGQDFKVLCSLNEDKIHYLCIDISKIDHNSYGFDKLIKDGSIRFTEEGNKTIIKMNKDSIERKNMKPSFIVVPHRVTDQLVSIANQNDLSIVVVNEE